MSFLIDTCTISEMAKPRSDKGLATWFEEADERTLYLSIITLGELWKGVTKLAPSHRKDKLLAWVRNELPGRFEGRVLSIDRQVAREWGRISGEAEGRGDTIPILDAMIGATACVHGLTVVTRSTADLERTGAKVFNPWNR